VLLFTSNDIIIIFFSLNQTTHDEPKFIVFKSCLFKLFEHCQNCNGCCKVEISHRMGTYIKISQVCSKCSTTNEWASQPMLHNVPAGNIILSAAILLTGSSPTKILRMLSIMNVASHTVGTYHNHARIYLHPLVWGFWLAHRMDLVEELNTLGGPLELGGDGRADSPGHSAKYGSYSLMELRINKVIDIELVQVNITIYYVRSFIILTSSYFKESTHLVNKQMFVILLV